MAAIERFEDIVAWQRARELTRAIYRVTREGAFARDFGLTGQIQRAAVSTMSNIAEGFDRKSPGEFHQYLVIAKGSCAETQSLLYVALDVGYVDQPTFDRLAAQAGDVARLISSLKATQAQRRSPSRRPNERPS